MFSQEKYFRENICVCKNVYEIFFLIESIPELYMCKTRGKLIELGDFHENFRKNGNDRMKFAKIFSKVEMF
jgi:hypothetical protein